MEARFTFTYEEAAKILLIDLFRQGITSATEAVAVVDQANRTITLTLPEKAER